MDETHPEDFQTPINEHNDSWMPPANPPVVPKTVEIPAPVDEEDDFNACCPSALGFLCGVTLLLPCMWFKTLDENS